MLKVYIVEDELLARDELKFLLSQIGQIEVVGETDCVQSALQSIQSLQPEVVFLDIELVEGTSLQLAEQIQSMEHPPAVVFATAYDEYALKAFELNAIDYILKPFNEERLRITLSKVQRSLEKDIQQTKGIPIDHNQKIALAIDDRIVLLQGEDIVYIESAGGKCTVKTKTQTYEVKDTLINIEKKLPPQQFIRVHRSFVVNVNHINEIHPWFNSTYNLVMKDFSRVPVSRSYVKELKHFFAIS